MTETRGEKKKPGTGRRWRGRLVAIGLVLAAAVAVGLVARMPHPKDDTPPPKVPPVNVEVWRVQPVAELPDTVTLTAVVEPERVVRVAAETAGRIERYGIRTREVAFEGELIAPGTPLEEGRPILAGEIILELERTVAQARYDRAQAQFEYDDREYRRLLDLYEQGATSKTELDDAATRRAISKAALDEAAHQLEQTTIRAPIDGILNRLPMEVGEYAGPGDVVAEIVVVDPVKIAVDVPERDIRFLNVGDTVEILLPFEEERRLRGPITYISELADEVTRTTRVEITVPNPEHELHAGQIVRARLTRRVLRDVILVPLDAVIPLEHGKAVYVVEEDRAERREVELGLIKERSVRILSGLSPGDRLIVKGHRYVSPGQPVTVVAENTGAAP